jgi:hypothetical protein
MPVPGVPAEPVIFNARLAVVILFTAIAAKLLINEPDFAILALTAWPIKLVETLYG